MAITRLPTGATVPTDGIAVKIDNGDLEAINNLVESLNFASPEAILRFTVAVLVKAGTNGVYVVENGNKIKLTPNDNLLRQNQASETSPQ